MKDKCKNCTHHFKHPHYNGIGICCNEDAPHYKKFVGKTLRCEHCTRRGIEAHEIAHPSRLSLHVMASEKRKFKVI